MPPKKKPRRAPRDWQVLAQSLKPPFLDFCRAKLEEGDEHVLKLVRDFKAKQLTCVFCGSGFDPRTPGKCTVQHDVECDDCERTAHGTWGSRYTYYGRCTRCGESIQEETEDEAGGDFDNPGVCYCGPHRSTHPVDFWQGDYDSDPYQDENEGEEEEEEEEEQEEAWVATSYHVVGSFSNWQIADDVLSREGQYFIVGRNATMSGSLRREMFQIVGDSDWNKRVYPAGPNSEENVLLRSGVPSKADNCPGRGHGRNWAIDGEPGAAFVLFFNPDAMTVTAWIQ